MLRRSLTDGKIEPRKGLLAKQILVWKHVFKHLLFVEGDILIFDHLFSEGELD